MVTTVGFAAVLLVMVNAGSAAPFSLLAATVAGVESAQTILAAVTLAPASEVNFTSICDSGMLIKSPASVGVPAQVLEESTVLDFGVPSFT